MRSRIVVGCPVWSSNIPWNKPTYDDKKIKLEADGETKETDYKLDGDYVTITVETETMKFKRQGK